LPFHSPYEDRAHLLLQESQRFVHGLNTLISPSLKIQYAE
jgi:hypothetical protein